MGLDQHDIGLKTVSSILKDAGIEVIYLGKLQIPDSVVKAAIEEDVNMIGISCHSWEWLFYIPKLMKMLKEKNLNHIKVIVGGVFSAKDEKVLKELGAKAVFKLGTLRKEVVDPILSL